MLTCERPYMGRIFYRVSLIQKPTRIMYKTRTQNAQASFKRNKRKKIAGKRKELGEVKERILAVINHHEKYWTIFPKEPILKKNPQKRLTQKIITKRDPVLTTSAVRR